MAKLPDDLFAAFDWTFAAGELETLRDLSGYELAEYVRESAENAGEHGQDDVSASDLTLLHDWLVKNCLVE